MISAFISMKNNMYNVLVSRVIYVLNKIIGYMQVSEGRVNIKLKNLYLC